MFGRNVILSIREESHKRSKTGSFTSFRMTGEFRNDRELLLCHSEAKPKNPMRFFITLRSIQNDSKRKLN